MGTATALRGAGLVPSPHHAERIAGEIKPYADRLNGVHFYDNLVVLKMVLKTAM